MDVEEITPPPEIPVSEEWINNLVEITGFVKDPEETEPLSDHSDKPLDKPNDHNDSLDVKTMSGSRSPSPLPAVCCRCQKVEEESQAVLADLKFQYEAEINRLKKEFEVANKAKETTVMRYANSEMVVMKVKQELENSQRQHKQALGEMEVLNKKIKMLGTERERLALMVDSKVQEIQATQKECERLKEDGSSKDFKIKWAQNKLSSEAETHKITVEKLETAVAELKRELECLKDPEITISASKENFDDTEEPKLNSSAECDQGLPIPLPDCVIQSNTSLKELEVTKQKNISLIEENNSLTSRVQSLELERLDLGKKLARLQESNSEHLHQIASLQSDLAATESLRVHLQKYEESLVVKENECQTLRQSHSEALVDMASCRTKEAELLAYTQQVTEKNVALQSEFSSVEAKSYLMEEENERLRRQIVQLETDMKNLEKMMSQESKHFLVEKQAVENDAQKTEKQITDLQTQLDEARGEIILLHKKLNSSVRELSKELNVARKQAKDSNPCPDGLSQSSRTSSNSSLTNGESAFPTKTQQDDPATKIENHSDQVRPVIPDQQILIERIIKLQRMLAKKQDKIEFLQEHVKQLVESVQKKSKIIQTYVTSLDVDALSSNISEQNKAEVLKHGGIMASVYGSKPADDGLTLDLSLEINRKLQVLLEDTLLKNMTLKDSLNTLGKEISKLTESNESLQKQCTLNPD